MHFQTAGQGSPPVLFVHGFACDLTDWRAQCDQLDTSVIACDLPGHGLTPGQPEECSVENYGAEVASLLTQLDLPPAVLVGHSMGCRVVLQAYRNLPQRVCGIVLLDGSRVASGERTQAEAGMLGQLHTQGYQNFVRKFFEEMFVASSNPSLRTAIIERALQMPEEIGAPLLARLAGWDAAEAPDALASVRVPLLAIQTTFVNSERVRVPLTAGQTSHWLELVRPYARVEILPELGHFPHIEQPAEINALLSGFLA